MKILVREKSVKILKRTPKKSIKELREHSLVILNKPGGPHSRKATRFLLDLGIKKAGHAGTLDPITTGVLPVFLNRGNKISGILTISKKIYRANMHLHKKVPKADIHKSVKKFTGKIEQLVPKRAAVKRRVRTREIYKSKIEKIDGRDVTLYVECEAGTYIRKLIHDIGEDLGVGANMDELERIKSGPFFLKHSHSTKVITTALKSKDETKLRKVLLPLERAVEDMPKVWVDDGVLKPFSYGSPIYYNGILQLTDNIEFKDRVALFNTKNELIGIGISRGNSKELLTETEGTAIRNDINLLKIE
tara:strand:+ start:15029 stop:15940 length:912 start_codon:yes stop_codon:yes gene_type:complete